jgi:hypothetical protein
MRLTAARPSSPNEVFVGKLLAMCAHPYAAWRTGTRHARVLLVAAYFTASYAVVLTLLQLGS